MFHSGLLLIHFVSFSDPDARSISVDSLCHIFMWNQIYWKSPVCRGHVLTVKGSLAQLGTRVDLLDLNGSSASLCAADAETVFIHNSWKKSLFSLLGFEQFWMNADATWHYYNSLLAVHINGIFEASILELSWCEISPMLLTNGAWFIINYTLRLTEERILSVTKRPK